MTDTEYTDAISSVAEIIEEARNGRIFILVDHEDRENEGDLVIPAQMATPDMVNFMAMHGRGLICLAMMGEALDRLGLPMMARKNETRTPAFDRVDQRARRSGPRRIPGGRAGLVRQSQPGDRRRSQQRWGRGPVVSQ